MNLVDLGAWDLCKRGSASSYPLSLLHPLPSRVHVWAKDEYETQAFFSPAPTSPIHQQAPDPSTCLKSPNFQISSIPTANTFSQSIVPSAPKSIYVLILCPMLQTLCSPLDESQVSLGLPFLNEAPPAQA